MPDERVEQAARDVANGLQDTGRSPVVTELTEREFPDAKAVDVPAHKTNP